METNLETPETAPNPRPKSTPKAEPIVIKRGNVSVKIYTGRNSVNGQDYEQFTVIYYEGNTRTKRKFSDLEKARNWAEVAATKMANGELEALKLTPSDRASYVQAMELLKPLGKPLNLAVADYVDCVKMLPPGVLLKNAVAFYLERNPKSLVSKTVAEVVNELVTSKSAKDKNGRGKSDVYLKDVRLRLEQFAAAFQMPISGVFGPQIEQYLLKLKSSGRTLNNHRRLITMLFRFAVRRKYLPRDFCEMDAVVKFDESDGDIEIFTRDELRLMLANARPEMIPWLAIGAFAGVRHAEIQRLDWSEINLAERHIEIKSGKAKTASRRLVPISDNLAAWLATCAKPFGPVTAFANIAKQINWLVEDINHRNQEEAAKSSLPQPAPFVWKRNGLRHSFISYRIAQIKDVAAVALEAGNSPQMIFKHYRGLVTEKQGNEWFATMPPEKTGNLVPFIPQAAIL